MLTRLVLMSFSLLVVLGCKEKKKPVSTGENGPVEVADFIDFFPEKKLPITIYDTSLNKRLPDSSAIAYSIFTEFIPDSILQKDFGKSKPKLYPLGKTHEKNRETYLFVKATLGPKKVGYLISFDNKNNYLNTLPLVKTGFDNYTGAYGSLDKKFQITTYKERKEKSGDISFKKNVFIYNDATRDFTLILTEPSEEVAQEVVNPIDTFPSKNKYSGDYVLDKRNLISFRDAKKSSEIIFYVHFEKNKGECEGDLKGIARFISAKTAQYKDVGNPCTLQFTFTNTSVVMKEVEGCGSFRDIKCFFDGTYPKKKKKTTKKS